MVMAYDHVAGNAPRGTVVSCGAPKMAVIIARHPGTHVVKTLCLWLEININNLCLGINLDADLPLVALTTAAQAVGFRDALHRRFIVSAPGNVRNVSGGDCIQ